MLATGGRPGGLGERDGAVLHDDVVELILQAQAAGRHSRPGAVIDVHDDQPARVTLGLRQAVVDIRSAQARPGASRGPIRSTASPCKAGIFLPATSQAGKASCPWQRGSRPAASPQRPARASPQFCFGPHRRLKGGLVDPTPDGGGGGFGAPRSRWSTRCRAAARRASPSG